MYVTHLAVRRPVAISMFFLAVVMLGLNSYRKLTVEFLPDINIPKLAVVTECPNIGAKEVDEKVTRRLEAAMSTIRDVENIRSVSKDGLSLIEISFTWGTDIDMKFIKVRGKLDQMQEHLPRFAQRPALSRFDPDSYPMMTLAVSSSSSSQLLSSGNSDHVLAHLKDLSMQAIKRRLEQIEGVGYVSVSGGLDREVKIHVNHKALSTLGVSARELERALREHNITFKGGMIKKGFFEFPVRINSQFIDVTDVRDVPVLHLDTKRTIFLRDVAEIVDGYEKRTSYTRLNGNDVISLALYKEADANTVSTTRLIYEVLEQMKTDYPGITLTPVYEQATLIQDSIDSVLGSLLWGGIFAFSILFLFLKNLRNPVSVWIAVPLSVLATLSAMYFLDIDLNIISLSGLALAIGFLVDNSIIVVESINRYQEQGVAYMEAAIAGTNEVSMAITASTLTTVSVFLPLVYVKGLAGHLFFEQAVTVSIALLVSLGVSITLVPMFESYRRVGKGESKPGSSYRKILLTTVISFFKNWIKALDRTFRYLEERYENGVRAFWNHRLKVLFCVILGICLSVALLVRLPREIMPALKRDNLTIEAAMPTGTTIGAMNQGIRDLENELRSIKSVAKVHSLVGIVATANRWDLNTGTNTAVINVEFNRPININEVSRKLSSIFMRFQPFSFTISHQQSFFEQFFEEKGKLFDVVVAGPELDILYFLGRQVTAYLESETGFSEVSSTIDKTGNKYVLTINKEKLIQYNISVDRLVGFLERNLIGNVPTQLTDFASKIDIRLQTNYNELNIETLKKLSLPLSIENREGYRIPLNELVDVEQREDFNIINRENQSRIVVISSQLQGQSFNAAKKKVEAFLSSLDLPRGYSVKLGSSRRNIEASQENLFYILLISICLIFCILAAQFESLTVPFVILFTLPVSLVGFAFTTWVTGNTLNLVTLTGGLILLGIMVNDTVVKVDFTFKLYRQGMLPKDAVFKAGRRRFRPIIMTTVTTIFGLLPMALSEGRGAELRQPLAWVIIGGLSISTLQALYFTPIVFSFIPEAWLGQRPEDKNVTLDS